MAGKRLFGTSWHSAYSSFERQAVADVETLNEEVFFDTSRLAAELESIVQKYAFEVAKMSPQAGTAKATKFHTGRGEVPALAVPIPFTGDAVSFEISPSTSNVLMVPKVDIEDQQVVVTVYEAGNPGREIEDFIRRGNENLDRLREEVQRYGGQLAKTVNALAARRKQAIEERRKRDESLPFKVDRS
jgi:hypothetical protein